MYDECKQENEDCKPLFPLIAAYADKFMQKVELQIQSMIIVTYKARGAGRC